jgi:hypothetical protein
MSAVVLLLLLCWILLNPTTICSDCAECLQTGQLLLLGKRPYVDFVSIVPPLIFYINVVPAGIAALLGAPLIAVFSITIWVLCVLSKLAILHVCFAAQDRRMRDLAPALILSASAFDVMTICFQGDLTFGQREHLIILFYWPYLILRWLRWNGGVNVSGFAAIVYGIGAGIGLCLKQYFVVLPIILEFYWLCEKRRGKPLFAPENVGLACFGLLYAAHFYVFSDAKIYVERWVPLILSGYGYCSFPLGIAFLVSLYVKGYPEILLLAALVAVPLRRRCSLIMPLLICAVVSYGVYLWQGKTWSYQAMPFISAIVVLGGVIAWVLLLQRDRHRMPTLYITSVCGGVLALFGLLYLEFSHWEAPFLGKPSLEVAQLVREKTSPSDSIVFLSTTPGDAYPMMVQLGRQPGCRYSFEYPLDLIAYSRLVQRQKSGVVLANGLTKLPDQYSAAEALLAQEITSDLLERKPKLIFVRQIPQGRANTNVSVTEFVAAYPQLAKALENSYIPLRRVGALQVYERK